jgi:hypothetical protein
MSQEPKIYVPKCSVKEHEFRNGGSILKMGIHAETMIAFLKEHANEKGYVNLAIGKRKEQGKYGDTHAVTLDTWKPSGQAEPGRSAAFGAQTDAQRQLAQRRAPAPAAAQDSPEEEGDGVPF